MPDAIIQPTVTIRVYDPAQQPDGIRQADLAIYRSAQFTRQRNTIGSFEIVIPLVPINLDLLNGIREGWLFEFWSESSSPAFLFGGYATSIRWGLEEAQTVMSVRGLSYLGWISQRRIIGGTGSKPWDAKDLLVEGDIGGYKPPVNELMYKVLVHNPTTVGPPPLHAYSGLPLGLCPPGTVRAHPMFRIPSDPSISHVTDAFSFPTLSAAFEIPRQIDTEITAYLSGMEVMNYLTERVGDRKQNEPELPWFGMPRVSYDLIRYNGIGVAGFPNGALGFIIRVPSLGVNRTVGNQEGYTPIIFDVDGGGVAEGEYIEDSSEVRNLIYTLGAGVGASRVMDTFSDTDSISRFGRVEDVLDAGQDGSPDQRAQKARDMLDERRDRKLTATFRLDVIPGQIFGTDFFFDDAVTVYWGDIGLVMNDFVTSVSLSMGGDEGGSLGIQKAQVTVGSEKLAPREGGLLGRYLNGLKRGITNLRI